MQLGGNFRVKPYVLTEQLRDFKIYNKVAEATEDRPAGLYIVRRVAAIVRRAFCMHASSTVTQKLRVG